MTHNQIKAECEALGLIVTQQPAEGRKSFIAVAPSKRVYWSTSYEGSLLGLPRVALAGVDTHARTIKEIRYLVTR